ncbi:chymotrypsin-1-like [Brevipalpus obovatus]|uniref:chymotrypsin-1-like n=1 Tax=Brevipalpus obovatus TaxID=246614 RepID=UPI003D9DE7BE
MNKNLSLSTKGGHGAKKEDFQYIVSIRPAEDPENHIGFGSIIHPRWILTVRHLFVSINDGDIKFLKIVVVPKYDNWLRKLIGKEKFQVESYYCLPLMKGRSQTETDLGLLKLSKPIELGNGTKYNFQAVRMIGPGISWQNYKYLDKYIRSAGWGSLLGLSDNLRYLRIISSNMRPVKCSSKLPTIRQPYGFCLANMFSSLCNQDLGGPGVIRADSDIQIGIAVFGSPKCKRSDMDAFINLTHYRDWVSRVIENGSKESECFDSLTSRKTELL